MEKLKFSQLGSFVKDKNTMKITKEGITHFSNNTTKGHDYYEMINYLIDNSPTTAACIDVLSILSFGRGINFEKIKDNKELYTFLVEDLWNEDGLNDMLRRLFQDFIKYNGFAIVIKVNKNGEITAMKHLNFANVRITSVDNFNTPTQYAYSNNWNNNSNLDLKKSIIFTPYNKSSKNPDEDYIYVYRQLEDDFGNIYPEPYWKTAFDSSRFEIINAYSHNSLYDNGIAGNLIVIRNYSESKSVVVSQALDPTTNTMVDITKDTIAMEVEALAESFTNVDGSTNAIIVSAAMNNIDNNSSVKPIEVIKTDGVDKDMIVNGKNMAREDICMSFNVPIDLVKPQSSTGLSSSADYINELYNRLQNTKVNAIQQTILSKLQKLISNCIYYKDEELIIDLFVDTNKEKTKVTSDTSTTNDVTNNNNNNNNNNKGGV